MRDFWSTNALFVVLFGVILKQPPGQWTRALVISLMQLCNDKSLSDAAIFNVTRKHARAFICFLQKEMNSLPRIFNCLANSLPVVEHPRIHMRLLKQPIKTDSGVWRRMSLNDSLFSFSLLSFRYIAEFNVWYTYKILSNVYKCTTKQPSR